MAKINLSIDTDTLEVTSSIDGREVVVTDAFLSNMDYQDSYSGEKRKYFHFSITEVEKQGDDRTHRVNHCWDADSEMEAESREINYKTESKEGLTASLTWQKHFTSKHTKDILANEIAKIIFKK